MWRNVGCDLKGGGRCRGGVSRCLWPELEEVVVPDRV